MGEWDEEEKEAGLHAFGNWDEGGRRRPGSMDWGMG